MNNWLVLHVIPQKTQGRVCSQMCSWHLLVGNSPDTLKYYSKLAVRSSSSVSSHAHIQILGLENCFHTFDSKLLETALRPGLPLYCYGKILIFMIKTLDYKSKITHSENVQKIRCEANHRHCAIHCKPETKKTGYSNVCVCLYRSLKLADDRVASQQFNSKHALCKLRFN